MTLMHATLLRKKYKGVSYGAMSTGRPLHPSDILLPLWTASSADRSPTLIAATRLAV
jgi:hypothetical protein